MNEQTKNLAAALAALLVVAIILAPPQQVEPSSYSNTEDKERYGLYAMTEWLKAAGYQTISHRTRFDSMMQYSQAATLIVHLPTATAIQRKDYHTLQTWLRSGDQLVVVVNNPVFGDDSVVRDFLGNLDIWLDEAKFSEDSEYEREEEQNYERFDLAKLNQPAITYTSTIDHPLFQGVNTLTLEHPLSLFHSQFDSEVAAGTEVISLYTDPESGVGIAWLLRSSEYPGGIFLLGHGDFMSNEGLLKPEQQIFAKNLFENFVARHETVIFADFYQGLSELYDVDALLADYRFQLSLVAVLLTWLIYVGFYRVRLGPVLAARVKLSNKDFSMAAGNLYARHTKGAEVNEQLLKTFNNTYRSKHRLPKNGRSVISHMQVNQRFPRELQAALKQLEAQPDLDPMKAQRLLHHLYQRLETS